MEEKSQFNSEDGDEEWDDDDETGEGESPLELMARLFSEHIQNAPVDDEFVSDLGETTYDQFLMRKGFDLSTLAGLENCTEVAGRSNLLRTRSGQKAPRTTLTGTRVNQDWPQC